MARPGAFQRIIRLSAVVLLLSACASFSPKKAVRVAQPDNTPVRNFTSFSPSLRCVDNMLAAHKRKRVLISSTGFPDMSKKVFIGADEMLVNAVNQMNRVSGTYVFIDQTLEKDWGQIDLLSPHEDTLEPNLYIRAAVTQVDKGVVSDSGSLDLDFSNSPNPLSIFNADFENTGFSAGRDVAVITVDMHLVAYPSKTVIPGSSVANTMVVVTDSRGVDGGGLIQLTGFDFSIKLERVESLGQAVRNLAELGVIELLGRHARIPCWECLNIRPTNQKLDNGDAARYAATPRSTKIRNTQDMLIALGYLGGSANGQMTQHTRAAISRFQADEKLIANGELNYQLFALLQEKTRGFSTDRSAIPSQKTSATASPAAIALVPDRQTYKEGDALKLRLSVNQDGYVRCFHQSGSGPITQILPHQPNQRIKASKGVLVTVPHTKASFDIMFEKAGVDEAVYCVLDQDVSTKPPTGLTKGPLKPVSANSFDAIAEHYRRSKRPFSSAEFRTRARR